MFWLYLAAKNCMWAILLNISAHLRTVLLRFDPEELHKAAFVDEVFLMSLYSQMEYHIQQQSILLNKQKHAIIALKRQPYIASIREKTAELALLDAVAHKAKLEERISRQNSLLESLKDKLNKEENESCDILSDSDADRYSHPPLSNKPDVGKATDACCMIEIQDENSVIFSVTAMLLWKLSALIFLVSQISS